MAHYLIGKATKYNSYISGSLPWHPTGSKFVGSGITEYDIPFSYHADWDSGGRWGIELVTNRNIYLLTPLEKLFKCKKGLTQWVEIDFLKAYPNVKQGLAEQIVFMLVPSFQDDISFGTIDFVTTLTRFAENVFGYSNNINGKVEING